MKKTKSSKSGNLNINGSQSVNTLSNRRLWLFRLTALIVVPLVFFTLLETALRLFNFGYSTEALIENDSGYIRENSEFAYSFFPEQVAPEFIPLLFKGEKPDSVYRIFVLGGSAAQGIPEPSYSFGRILEVMLNIKYPAIRFEVLSLAMTAINSHVVAEIARDCAEYDPDLIIVYLGNNEVIGPYGPGSVFAPIISNRTILDLTKRLKTTKTYQLISQGLEELNLLKPAYNRWAGMEMFTQNRVRPTDPLLEVTYKNFEDNLNKINSISKDNDIKVVYSTVAVNLKDCPPFSSVHSMDISQPNLRKWEEFYSSGSAHEETGDYRAAITDYLEAARLDSPHAVLQYKLGRCYWQTGNYREARQRFANARDYDANRFRADNRINEIIRSAAEEIPGTTFLADALAKIEMQSPNMVPGNEFLLEHVHLNFKGNFQVAKAVLQQVQNLIPGGINESEEGGTVQISDSLCAAYLAYNTFEHHRILELVLNGFIKQPPFTNQLYHSAALDRLETALDSLKEIMMNQGISSIINSYETALQKRPSDWMLHNRYADYLSEDNVRKYKEAEEHFRFVMQAVPHDPNSYVKRGVVYGKLGQLQEALKHFQLAVKNKPSVARAYFNMGLIYQKQNKIETALENYKKAILYEPAHSRAYNNMAYIYDQRGDISKAMSAIDQGLKYKPEDLLLNYNKAIFLYKSGNKSEAIEQLRYVSRIAPGEARVREQLNEWLKNE